VEWTAAIGQAVQTDDVIALIETDKVTIDIKADMNGVITQHFGSVYVFVSLNTPRRLFGIVNEHL
jgi:pyruvate/2-oxoglutarate dehydrogenase complex dihydrolipoamide acyltransferase (E2) component